MIGKKAAIGIIAATGVVAVGVPVGIVVGQHASKHESLDSKMTNKWSDIERELASSFGGFDVRNAESVDANQKERDAQLKVVTDTKTLIDKIIGINGDAKPWFNSFTQIDKNMGAGVEKLRTFAKNAIDEYAAKGLEVVGEKIVKKTPSASDAVALTLDISEKDGSTFLKTISAKTQDAIQAWAIPFDVKLEIVKEGSTDKIVSFVDANSFDAFVYEGQLSNGTKLQQTPLGQFRNYVKEVSRTSNQYKLPDLANKIADLTGDKGTLGYFVSGKLVSAPNVVNDQSLAKLFGLKNIIDLLPLSANNDAAVLKNITDDIFMQTRYLDYSVRGHHDERLVKASIANWGEDNNGDDFTAKGFTWTAPTQSDKTVPAEDQIFTWAFSKTHGEVYRDKTTGKFVASTSDELISPDPWNKGYLELKDMKSERFAKSSAAIADFNAQNAAKELHTFTNEERFAWCVEEALMKDADGNDLPGETIAKLSPIFKEAKINYQAAKEWHDQGEFSLLLNQGQFDSVLRKFNISPAEADFQITITNENGGKYVLTVAPNGQLYLKGDASQTPLFTKGLTEEDKAKYPMASPEWYSANNQIAYSQSTTASSIYDLETNAPFMLGNNTTISFALAIRNKETNTEYKNTDAGRKAQVFGLNQDGELFVNNEGAKA